MFEILVNITCFAVFSAPHSEITFWSYYYDVPLELSLAVERAETGNLPDVVKDNFVSTTGDYGRFQINCRTWHRYFNINNCDAFKNRHFNIWAGIYIIDKIKKKYQNERTSGCRCGSNHYFIAHYNDGFLITARGKLYANKV